MIIYIVRAGDELKPFVATQHRVDGEMVETTKENPMPAEGKDEDIIVIKLDDIMDFKQAQYDDLDRANKQLRRLIDESYREE